MEERDPTYFSYYSQLINQQNMLSDHSRTNIYKQVTLKNARQSFYGKQVMDIGAGSGILSYFACQAGSETVFAIEASSMALKMQRFIDCCLRESRNSNWLRENRIKIIHDKIENIIMKSTAAASGDVANSSIPLKCSIDTLISEPIGVLLVHERMLESFVAARDHFLRPGGDIYPTTGRIHLAPFCDINLWAETMQKAKWWQQPDFHGIDLGPLFGPAKQECFSMPVVGPFSPSILLSDDSTATSSISIDFRTVKVEELLELKIPCRFVAGYTGLMHGIAGWFDCDFIPNSVGDSSGTSIGTSIGIDSYFSLPSTNSNSGSGANSQQNEQTSGSDGLEDLSLRDLRLSGAPQQGQNSEDLQVRESENALKIETSSAAVLTLSTHPAQPMTHWQQVRFLLVEPLAVNRGDVIIGELCLKANRMRSYSITAEFWLEDFGDDANSSSREDGQKRKRASTHRSGSWELQDQLYNYNSMRPDVSHDWFGMYSNNKVN